ncbi:MAG TPA: hypothetical protein PK438_02190 [Clostridia bacterium]|nr:MAG: hypothetical protein BWY35_01397 [Firmicutes bacterium ADurb.Bin248]HOF99552.1 hypothetical protein [Clostridia bacterium]HOS18072.1 hypothetical protein [Clostridia bacterium]HPK15432.1 hypothetical protein [Clostridia bacterium]
MRTIILYYTFGGATMTEAEKLASELKADCVRVREKKKRGLFTAFLPGCPQAMKRKASDIEPLGVDLTGYDRIALGAPIWASYPAPAFNSMVKLLPANKEVELFFCSGGGDTSESRAGTIKLVEDMGCTVVSYRDVNTGGKPKKLEE